MKITKSAVINLSLVPKCLVYHGGSMVSWWLENVLITANNTNILKPPTPLNESRTQKPQISIFRQSANCFLRRSGIDFVENNKAIT